MVKEQSWSMVVGHQKSSEFSDSALLTDSWAEEQVWRPREEGKGGRPGEEGEAGLPREEGEAGRPREEKEVEAAERPQEKERFQ